MYEPLRNQNLLKEREKQLEKWPCERAQALLLARRRQLTNGPSSDAVHNPYDARSAAIERMIADLMHYCTSCEIAKPRIDLFPLCDVFQNISYAPSSPDCDGITRIKLRIVEIEL